MTEPRKPSLILPVAGAALLGLYVGAYYAMITPTPLYGPTTGIWLRPRVFPVIRVDAWYTIHGRGIAEVAPIFSPMNRLDRRIRPHVWEPTEQDGSAAVRLAF